MRRWHALLVALMALGLLAGCASTAPLRENAPGSRPQAGSDEDELWYAMERAERELQRSPLLVRDPALNAYVREVACRAAAAHCRDLRVYIMDVPEFNASMAPNGVMLVWTGALLRMRNEAELAFVLGHEAGHFTAQHSIRQWRRIKDTSALINAFQVLAFAGGAPNVAMLGGLAGYATIFKFSRDMEREADRLGVEALLRENYDPQAGAELWARMLAEERARPYQKRMGLFSTHPPSAERLEDIREVALAAPASTRERGGERYRKATRPFLQRWLAADLAQRRYASSLLLVEGLLQDAPATERGLLTFQLGEIHRRRAGAGDRERAAALYAEAVTFDPAPAAAWREHGYALQAGGQHDAARMALRRYLQQAPDASDRAVVERALEKLGAPR
ncbi:M48 family metalloprotease [Luteimonas sp. e5]